MERIYVRGGRPLTGSIRVSGSKNSSLAIMPACLLVDGVTTLHNVPNIKDIQTMATLLRQLGARVDFKGGGTVVIDSSGFSKTEAPEEMVRAMRASFYVLGPMLARLGRASVAQPGGCNIGSRPVDFHVKGFTALGADMDVVGGVVQAECEQLKGARIYFDFPSAGATSHLMAAAALADGVTTIDNAAHEPEIEDLAHFLTSLGAEIEGAGSQTITIRGVDRLQSGREHTIIPDRIEAGTFACAAAITGSDVRLENVLTAHLHPVLVKLGAMGVELSGAVDDPEHPGLLRVHAPKRTKSVDILAMPHPGFPTDMQQPMVSLLSVSRGAAMVTDRVFENRFRWVSELQRMGADIVVDGRTAMVRGVDQLRAASVNCTDLRAGAALLVAALGAEGESTISGIEHLDRGYEDVVKKLLKAGADIVRADVEGVARMLSA